MMAWTAEFDLTGALWPLERLAEAIDVLAQRSGLNPRATAPLPAPLHVSGDRLRRWVDSVATQLDIEAEPVEIRHGFVPDALRNKAPLVLELQWDGQTRYLCVASGQGRHCRVVYPDRTMRRLPAAPLHAVLRATIEGSELFDGVERLLVRAAVPRNEQADVRRVYLRHAVGHLVAVEGWTLRATPGSDFGRQLRLAEVPGLLATFLASHAWHYSAWVLSWWLLGRAALAGRFDSGWFLAWALLLLSLVPVRVWSAKLEGQLAIGIGALLKRRLLDGALRLAPEETRTQGIGQLLGRALESEGIEAVALGGGFQSVAAAVELLIAGLVMLLAGGGPAQALVLLVWTLLTAVIAVRLLKIRRRWADQRLDLTHDLVEAMVGYRTRLAQEAPDRWHVGEDQALARFMDTSRALDRATVLLTALVPRGWLLAGFLGLLPAATTAGAAGRFALAIGVGGTLLAHAAFKRLTAGFTSLVDAAVAWRHVKPLFEASARQPEPGLPLVAAHDGDLPVESDPGRVVLEAHDLTYRYPGRAEPALRGCRLELRAGERVLLEGPSGSGKSTLAGLLARLRTPDSGLLLVRGLDYPALGEQGWRKRVVVAPQFHENHVLAETFLFNLLMGRRWPPDPEDVKSAIEICAELGLGPLIARMPAGLQQLVGDTGWQLSHGERSRLFVARALLQGAEAAIFDESFAALDPATLRACLMCVLRRAPATVVIAHP